jgi:hypothetical protein
MTVNESPNGLRPMPIAPPKSALLPENVLSVTVSVPKLRMAAPLLALLPEKVLFATVSMPRL